MLKILLLALCSIGTIAEYPAVEKAYSFPEPISIRNSWNVEKLKECGIQLGTKLIESIISRIEKAKQCVRKSLEDPELNELIEETVETVNDGANDIISPAIELYTSCIANKPNPVNEYQCYLPKVREILEALIDLISKLHQSINNLIIIIKTHKEDRCVLELFVDWAVEMQARVEEFNACLEDIGSKFKLY